MAAAISGLAISATVSIITAVVVMLCFSSESAQRYAGALGLAIGFLAYNFYFEQKNLSPTLHWQWLPWLVASAAILGPVVIAQGVGVLERLVMIALFSLVAAWLLMPTRASFAPQRLTYLLNLTIGLTLFWNLLDRLTHPKNGAVVFMALWATIIGGSVLVAYAFSVRIGFLGIVGAVAICGGVIAALWKRDPMIVRGLIGPAAVLLAGQLLTAEINDAINPPTIALVAIAPLMLWLFEAGPLARLKGSVSHVTKAMLVALPLIAAWRLSISGIRIGESW